MNRREVLQVLGIGAGATVAGIAGAKEQRKPMAYRHATVQCAACLHALVIRGTHEGTTIERALGECVNQDCENLHVLVEVPGQPMYALPRGKIVMPLEARW